MLLIFPGAVNNNTLQCVPKLMNKAEYSFSELKILGLVEMVCLHLQIFMISWE